MTPDDGSHQTVGDPQSWNLYAYVRNQPLRYVDPTGHGPQGATAAASSCAQDQGGGGHTTCNVDTSGTTTAQNTFPFHVPYGQQGLYGAPCPVDACVTATAPKSIWGKIGSWFGGVAFGIVRWGKLGGPLHRAGVERVSRSLEESGFKVQREVRVPTPNGAKSSRWVDVVGTKNGETRMYQIGRQNMDGTPVAREVQALDDIEGATGIRPNFLPYNIGEPNFGVPGATDIAPGVTPGEGEVPVEPEIIPE